MFAWWDRSMNICFVCTLDVDNYFGIEHVLKAVDTIVITQNKY